MRGLLQKRGLYRIAGLASMVTVWQLLAWWVGEPRSLPGPLPVLQEVWDLIVGGPFFSQAWVTISRVLIGLGIAFVGATILGLVMGMSPRLESMLDSFVIIGMAIPGLAFAIIALILFGLNERAAVIGVAATVLPLLALNMWQGTKAVDQELLEMARAFGVSRRDVVRWIRIPALAPYLLAALRLGLSISWKVVVIAEMLGTASGIGFQIFLAFSTFRMAGVLAWTITFSLVIAGLEFLIIRPVERRVLRWRREAEGSGVDRATSLVVT